MEEKHKTDVSLRSGLQKSFILHPLTSSESLLTKSKDASLTKVDVRTLLCV